MSDLENEVMPFGKHKGKPLVEVAADANYIEWMRKKGGFESFLNKIENLNILVVNQQPNDDTPEHNRMQMYYFKPENLMRVKFLSQTIKDSAGHKLEEEIDSRGQKKACLDFYESNPEEYMRELDKYFDQCISLAIENTAVLPEVKAKGGYADLVIQTKYDYNCQKNLFEFTWGQASVWPVYMDFMIELKPSIGNDYPAVIRQISKMQERGHHYNPPPALCICWDYDGSEAFEDVQELFAASGIRLVKEDT